MYLPAILIALIGFVFYLTAALVPLSGIYGKLVSAFGQVLLLIALAIGFFYTIWLII
ncbi:hypothetical protein [Bremerella sp. P1]|uniref:hypothetical protein n=1 Tax=Bremerella sp. P1 TaxID=3026424 RepID=UPI002368C0E6|nr:hypothetical protein [Bremerella sp. P1]WDI40694.1 hypothetical protein PSR63_19660 [Bremerella sp. P1]